MSAPAVDHDRTVGRGAVVHGLLALVRPEKLVGVLGFALQIGHVESVEQLVYGRPRPFTRPEARPVRDVRGHRLAAQDGRVGHRGLVQHVPEHDRKRHPLGVYDEVGG